MIAASQELLEPNGEGSSLAKDPFFLIDFNYR